MQRLARYVQQPVLDLPAEHLPEYCTRPYGHVLLLMVNEQDGSLHGPWAAMPGTHSPDQAAVQQVCPVCPCSAVYYRYGKHLIRW